MTDREKVIKAVDICRGNGHCGDCQYYQGHAGYTIMDCRKYLLNDALELLKTQPQIVRCKDCKKHDTYDCNITYLTTQKTPNDWFCADGEREPE